VYDAYAEAFTTLHQHDALVNAQHEQAYTSVLSQFIDNHMDIVTLLANGVKESRKSIRDPSVLDRFLDRTIRSRIGIRLLIEQQLSLHLARPGFVGVICQKLLPNEMIRKVEVIARRMCVDRYGRAPSITITGDGDATFSYIPVHFEYILQELFKNAFRATVEHNAEKSDLPDVVVTICFNGTDMILRISDQGGGIARDIAKDCLNWSFTTVEDVGDTGGAGMLGGVGANASGDGPLAGLGFGLPTSKVYAEYFGGALEVLSMHGYGTDVYLRLSHLGVDADGKSPVGRV